MTQTSTQASSVPRYNYYYDPSRPVRALSNFASSQFRQPSTLDPKGLGSLSCPTLVKVGDSLGLKEALYDDRTNAKYPFARFALQEFFTGCVQAHIGFDIGRLLARGVPIVSGGGYGPQPLPTTSVASCITTKLVEFGAMTTATVAIPLAFGMQALRTVAPSVVSFGTVAASALMASAYYFACGALGFWRGTQVGKSERSFLGDARSV